MLKVIHEPQQIVSSARQFVKLLVQDAVKVTKEVAFPGIGKIGPSPVYSLNTVALWASHREDKDSFLFWFGTDLERQEPLTPSIEINFSKTFDRRRKGRFLTESNETSIGHRGLLAGGRASVPMKEFDRHIQGFSRQPVMWGVKQEKIYVLGALNSSDFLLRLQRYVVEAERIRDIKRQEKRG